MKESPYVFISYKSENRDVADMVRTGLINHGINCWMDEYDIENGSFYATAIPPAIKGCTVFLLVLSNLAGKSKQIMNEVSLAHGTGNSTSLYYLKIEEVPITDEIEYFTQIAQMNDISKRPLDDDCVETIVGDIQRIINQTVSTIIKENKVLSVFDVLFETWDTLSALAKENKNKITELSSVEEEDEIEKIINLHESYTLGEEIDLFNKCEQGMKYLIANKRRAELDEYATYLNIPIRNVCPKRTKGLDIYEVYIKESFIEKKLVSISRDIIENELIFLHMMLSHYEEEGDKKEIENIKKRIVIKKQLLDDYAISSTCSLDYEETMNIKIHLSGGELDKLIDSEFLDKYLCVETGFDEGTPITQVIKIRLVFIGEVDDYSLQLYGISQYDTESTLGRCNNIQIKKMVKKINKKIEERRKKY